MAAVPYRRSDKLEHHSAQVWASAALFNEAKLKPGAYVRVTWPRTAEVAFRQVRLLPAPKTPDDPSLPTTWLGTDGDLFQADTVLLHELPAHRLPTITHLHLEWIPSATVLPPPPTGLMPGALLQDGMLWACQWFGTDYGQWRCRLFPHAPCGIPGAVIGVVGTSTQVSLSGHPSCSGFRLVDVSEVGGVASEALANLWEVVAPHLAAPSAPCQVLVQGALGSGKMHTVQQLARQCGARLLLLDATLVVAVDVAPLLASVVAAAIAMAPAIICIPHIERIFPKSLGANGGGSERRIIELCATLTGLANATAAIAVVCTAVDADGLHPKIRACFGDELAMPVTTLQFRRQLLAFFLDGQPLPNGEAAALDARLIQSGHQPSDVAAIARSLDLSTQFASLRVTPQRGSSVVSVPSVRWTDIGGADDIKQQLQEMVVWPFEKPKVFERMGIAPPIGLILYGPPGTGKTMLAKAAATATACNFLNVTASDLLSSEFGASERALADVFRTAKAMSPCIIFIDEFQSIFANRASAGQIGSSMASLLLQEMDALKAVSSTGSASMLQYVFVLAATNCLDAIDDAFLQPGRFENILYVGYPDAAGRSQILTLLRGQMQWAADVAIDGLVAATDGLSAAEIVSVVRTAGLLSLMQHTADEIDQDAFDQALLQVWQRHIPPQ
ncbi:ATPase [Achlya hypogyna]|uniref:ATPase n=1 Tax=Achlya hypogyna TaxID=1202772 RepID=A0A1V9YZN9_ACHHY|nr:ATPase [Achlya hypogyna]